jgi:hypothetical protein
MDGPQGHRILEARFHPFERESPTFVVIAHLVWRPNVSHPEIRASPSIERHTASRTMLATIRHLVGMTTPGSFERLQAFENRFWSFRRVEDLPVLHPAS